MKIRNHSDGVFCRLCVSATNIVFLFSFAFPAVTAEKPDVDPMMLKLFALHSELAKQGNIESIVKLGIMYERGEGVAKNRAKAIELFGIAAMQDNKIAQDLLEKIKSSKPDDRLIRDTAEISVPVSRTELLRQKRAELERQKEQERKAQQKKEVTEAARLELESLRRTHLEEQEKQQRLKQEIEQVQKAQEKLARERAKAEQIRRDMESAANKHAEELNKQMEQANKRQDPTDQEFVGKSESDQQNSEEKRNFSANPCNTPAAVFMSTCNL